MKKIITIILVSTSVLGFSQSINNFVLEEIKNKSLESHSDAVIIIKDGKTIYEDYFDKAEKPIYIASAGKSLTSLAIGKLIDLKLIDSLNQPVHTLYPQWKQGKKKDITIRMLLNHTSGIQNNPNASVELEPAPDYQVQNIIDLALAAELTNIPGKKFAYNNKAVALLGGIVEKASGKRFDEFFIDEFYKPMDITNYSWIKDKEGNPTNQGAFVIKPSDLIKFGQLILNKGKFNGQRLNSESWIKESFLQGQEFDLRFGLLWWRFPEYEKRIIDDEIWKSLEEAKVPSAFLKKMKPLKNKLFKNKYEFNNNLKQALGDDWSQELKENLPNSVKLSKHIYGKKVIAYYANGYRGNYLVIIPQKNIVAVRCADHDGFNYQTDFFNDFVKLITQL